MYTGSDIEVFIVTRNRVHYLVPALQSIIGQTAKGIKITVVDNGSESDIKPYIQEFLDNGIGYIRKEVNSRHVFNEIGGFSTRDWTMIFHDDDILDENYLTDVLRTITQYPSIALVASGMRTFSGEYTRTQKKIDRQNFIPCASSADLAALLFNDSFSIPFPSAVYRTSVLRKNRMKFEVYGKTSDRQLIMDVTKDGGAIVLKGKYMNYRLHATQDSVADADGPFAHEILALGKYYRNELGTDLTTEKGRLFVTRNYFRFSRWYEWIGGIHTGLTHDEFIQLAIDGGATTSFNIWLGKWFSRLFLWPYQIKQFLKRVLAKRVGKRKRW